jgi:hypothetical protein
MRRISLMLLVVALFASVTASAPKKQRIPGPTPPTPQMVTIQDEEGEGYMVFDLTTGAYKCNICEYGYSVGGVGSIKTDGCLVFFSAIGDGYTVTAFVSLCEQMAKCSIQVTKQNGFDIEPWEEVLSDPNLRDSKATCGAVEPPPSELPSDIILQNDADGSFLYLVTATGEFKFIHCEDNTAMSGVGKVTRSGSWLNFEVITNEYRVLASINLDAKTGKAVIDIFAPIGAVSGVNVPMQEIISDSNFTDNVTVCGAKK